MVEEASKSSKIICFCNNVSEQKIIAAISQGAQTLGDISDQTQAGSGPCGGTCRDKIKALLSSSQNLKTNTNDEEELPLEVIEAVSLFNRRYYWEAHEVLEKIWLEEHGTKKKLYQGIIQAAASFYHVLNANPQGTLKLALEARQKLDPFRPNYWGIELDLLCERLEIFYQEAKEILGKSRAGFSYELLPKIKIGSEMQI